MARKAVERPESGSAKKGGRKPARERIQPGRFAVIDPNAVFTVPQLQAALFLPDSTINREIRLGHLQARVRAGKRFILGQWVLTWIASGKEPKVTDEDDAAHGETPNRNNPTPDTDRPS